MLMISQACAVFPLGEGGADFIQEAQACFTTRLRRTLGNSIPKAICYQVYSFYQVSCVFTLQVALCAWECLIWPFRDSPRSRFSAFSSFGTPRKRIFQIFRASGPPDGSFSQKTTRRGIPKHYFSEFLSFGMPRSVIFPIFRSSLISENAVFDNFLRKITSDGLFSAFFAHRLQAKRCFWHFSMKNYERRMIFSIFSLSSAGES